MASAQNGLIPTKLSFAKVAAMNVPSTSPSPHNLTDDKKAKAQSPEPSARRRTVTKAPLSLSQALQSPVAKQIPAQTESPVKINSDTVFVGQTSDHAPALASGPPSPLANGSKSGRSGDSGEDDQSHLSSSSTKQTSFETKSMASVTTFAMDEKESIRPDDSASVRAVDEEDAASTLSRSTPFPPEPDVIMPAVRGATRTGAQMPMPAIRRFHTLANPPRFGTLEEPVSDQAEESETTSSIEPPEGRDAPQSLQGPPPPPATPDEKLVDALASPKDRLPVLQLEQKLLEFIHQSAVDYIDLPPQHSYARLLAHKLADYYGLLHVINEDGTSIRVFRTTNVISLPTSLETLAKSIPTGSSQSLGLTAVKIMRRAGLPRQFSTTDSTAPSSSAPSKATSEAGHSEEGPTSPTEASTPSRDRSKMTREEREAQYKAARERIFGNMDELAIGENNSTGETSASMSRSSSSSGKKKTRKQRTPKDDSFDSRSAFVPGYGGLHVQQTQVTYQPHNHNDLGNHHQYESSQQAYGPQINYSSTPTQAEPGLEHQMQFHHHAGGACDHGQNPGCANPDGWSTMQSQAAVGANFFNYPQHVSGYGPAMSSMMPQISQPFSQQQQGWNNNGMYQNGFQQPFGQQGPNMNWQAYQPAYSQQFMQAQGGMIQGAFGPNTRNPMMGQYVQPSQHNVDSNYARQSSLFNPQTKTFVPSNGAVRAGGRGNNKKKHSPASTKTESRQTSVSKSQPPPTTGLHSARQPEGMMIQPVSARPTHDSLQQKYGKPANLPKKPPPSQAPGHVEAGSVQAVRRESGNPSVVGGGGGSNSGSGEGKAEQ